MTSTEVPVAPRKKRYTPAFKLRLIEEADRCHAPGELGALLRREGIYFSTLTDFRKQKARGDIGEQRSVQKLIPEAAMETLPESFLPGTARIYIIR